MTEKATETAITEANQPVSLKLFFALCFLWMPLAFFFWFFLRSVVTWPVSRLSHWVIDAWLPGVVHSWRQNFHHFEITALVPPPPGMELPDGQLAAAIADVNVLLYTYGIAVLWGLLLATPNDERSFARRLVYCFVGWMLLIPVHVFSTVIDVGKTLFIELGPAGLQLAETHGVNLEFIALFFQFSRLVAPTLGAVIVWALFNRKFIEEVRNALPLEPEPLPGQDGPNQPAAPNEPPSTP
jgi:hypothetical protein